MNAPLFTTERYAPSQWPVAPSKPTGENIAPPKLDFVSAASLGPQPPRRHFLVPELIPGRNVTLLSGDGGTGKSLLVAQVAQNWG